MTDSSGRGAEFVISRATPEDFDHVITVLNEAAQWVVDRGADGWRPGQWRAERLLEAINGGETFLASRDGEIVGTITLQSSDDLFWAGKPPDAGYVHRLAVTAASHGLGIGRAMLVWAEGATSDKGRPFLRLDCPCGNPSLRRYYEGVGFEPRGEKTISGTWGAYCAALYEKVPASRQSPSFP